MDVARILIAVPVHNRLRLAALCVSTIRAGMKHGHDALVVYDDGSDETVPDEVRLSLIGTADYIERVNPARGIDKQRAQHFIDFWLRYRKEGYTHLYLTDADAPHDPTWAENLLRLQGLFGGAPICGYRTSTHVAYTNNVYHDNPAEDVIFQRFAPGVSYLLTADHVAEVMKEIHRLRDWDWFVPAILGNKFAVSRVSYCDHIGAGGTHDPASGVGPERALNPTPFLIQKRAEILTAIGLKDALHP